MEDTWSNKPGTKGETEQACENGERRSKVSVEETEK
jgi:hypothetical protein